MQYFAYRHITLHFTFCFGLGGWVFSLGLLYPSIIHQYLFTSLTEALKIRSQLFRTKENQKQEEASTLECMFLKPQAAAAAELEHSTAAVCTEEPHLLKKSHITDTNWMHPAHPEST